MIIRCFIIISFVLFSVHYSFSQKEPSLQKEFSSINEQFWKYINSNTDSANFFAKKGMNCTQKDSALYAKALNNLGIYFYYTDQFDSALYNYHKASLISSQLQDSSMLARLFNNSAIIHDIQGNYIKALELYDTAAHIHKNLDNWNNVAQTYTNMGIVYKIIGKYEQAIILYEQAIEIHDSLDQISDKAFALSSMALIKYEQGKTKEAIELHNKALDIFHRFGLKTEEANQMLNLASIYSNEGAENIAIDLLTKAKNQYTSLNQASSAACSLIRIAKLQDKNNETENAVKNLEEALRIFRSSNFKIKEFDVLLELANIARKQKHFDLCDSLIIQSEEIATSMQSEPNLARVYTLKGKISIDQQKPTESLQFLNKAFKIFETNNQFNNLLEIELLYAQIDEANNQLENATQKALNAFNKATKSSVINIQITASYLLYHLYEKRKLYQQANYYLNYYHELNNKSNNAENIKRITAFQIESDYNKKILTEKHIAHQNELLLNSKLKYHRNITTLLLAFVLLLTLTCITIYVQFTRKNKAHKMLVSKNKELTELYQKYNRKKNKQENSRPKIKDQEKSKYLKSLKKLIEEDQIYINPDLKLSDVSKALSTNNNYISLLINEEFNKNFNQYINDFRIKKACLYFQEGKHINHSIEGISKMSGFNNRSSFISAFKKYTGVTPSFYIQSLKIANNQK